MNQPRLRNADYYDRAPDQTADVGINDLRGSQALGQHSTLNAALAYADNGWHVLPVWLKPTRKPGIADWQNRATINLGYIQGWFNNEFRNAAVGIATGHRSGLVVIDVDPRNGGTDSFLQLLKLGELRNTLTIATPRGGLHYYFTYAEPLKSTSKNLGAGIDVKADGGFVIAPPSPDYRIVHNVEPAQLPSWLITACHGGHPNSNSDNPPVAGFNSTSVRIITVDSVDGYASRMLELCADDVRYETFNRNVMLNNKAFKLSAFIAGGYFTEAEVREALTNAALDAGLERAEIKNTLDSALSTVKTRRPVKLVVTRLGA